MTTQQRSSYWDNAKAVLIFLVVLAHYIGYGSVYQDFSGGLWDICNAVYGFIYMFHMPLFAFVSGYFTRNPEKARSTACKTLLLPYILFNTIYIIMDHLLLGGGLYNPVFYPYNHMWYLFALFVWRYFSPEVRKLRHSWLWLLIFSAFCSYFLPGKNWVLLSRVITFWPFFALGQSVSPEMISRLRRIPKWLCAGVLCCALAGSYILLHWFDVGVFQLCFFSDTFPQTLAGILHLPVFLGRYLAAVILGICILNLTPERNGKLTVLGRRTMTIFLLHSMPGLRNRMALLNPLADNPLFTLFWCAIWSALATLAFGCGIVDRAYRKGMQWLCHILPRAKGPQTGS